MMSDFLYFRGDDADAQTSYGKRLLASRKYPQAGRLMRRVEYNGRVLHLVVHLDGKIPIVLPQFHSFFGLSAVVVVMGGQSASLTSPLSHVSHQIFQWVNFHTYCLKT